MSTTVYVEYSGDTLVGAIDGANKAFTISRNPDTGRSRARSTRP